MNHYRRAKLLGIAALVVLGVLLAVALAGCGTATTTTTALPATTTTAANTTTTGANTTTTGANTTTTGISSTSTSGPTGGTPAKIEVALSGDQSVPPVQTSASGKATIMIEQGATGLTISFELDVTNLVDVAAAHIHLGAAGANGPVIVPLFTGPAKSGSFTGVLAQGTITEADLAGPMKGKTFADLAAAVLGGQTYVNVHTKANPNGEIRGQIIIPGAGGAATTTTAAAGTATTAAAATATTAAAATATTAAGGY